MEELFTLPQIVSGRTQEVRDRAAALFRKLTDTIVELEPEEAELAKLFTNTWRYIKFAAANQFYVMANDHGLDFDRIRKALAHDYPRAADMPGAGFAAGPCLLKDTMQLAAFTDNSFVLGHAAMLINEGLPLYLVSHLEKQLRPGEPARRHPRHGVQGRERRHPLEPVLQAQADPGVQVAGGAVHRPLRDGRRDPRPARATARRVRPARARRAACGVPRARDRPPGRGRVEPAGAGSAV